MKPVSLTEFDRIYQDVVDSALSVWQPAMQGEIAAHYPHSLKIAMGNIISLLKPGGSVHIEVPNIAYFPKRMAFLSGRSPLVPIEDIYQSKIPYIGHHHEFTLSELRKLASLANLEIERELSYNCSIDTGTLGYMLKKPLEYLAYSLVPATRECLAITCRREA